MSMTTNLRGLARRCRTEQTRLESLADDMRAYEFALNAGEIRRAAAQLMVLGRYIDQFADLARDPRGCVRSRQGAPRAELAHAD